MSNIRTLKDNGSDYPISSNIDGAVYSLISNDCVIGGMGGEFAISYSTTSLVVTFGSGSQALIGGNAFWLTADTQVTLPSNSTFKLCLRIDTSKSSGNTGSIEALTGSAIKSGNINEGGVRDLPIYQITTGSSGVTKVTDLRTVKSASDNSRMLKGVLAKGSTSITMTSNLLTDSSIVSVYSSILSADPTAIAVSNGSITLTFDEQDTSMQVVVEIVGNY